MQLLVTRMWPTAKSITGILSVNGSNTGYTLEPAVTAPYWPDHPAIPEGTYKVTIRWSPKFTRLMPHVEDVPGRSSILIHWGNYPKDTEGCLIVGKDHGTDVVMESKVLFDDLFLLLTTAEEHGEEITITYRSPA